MQRASGGAGHRRFLPKASPWGEAVPRRGTDEGKAIPPLKAPIFPQTAPSPRRAQGGLSVYPARFLPTLSQAKKGQGGCAVSEKRLLVVFGIFLAMFGVVMGRLFLLASNTEYAARAREQTVSTLELPAERGNIYDCNGQ